MRVCDVGGRAVKRGRYYSVISQSTEIQHIADISHGIYFMIIKVYIVLNAGGKKN